MGVEIERKYLVEGDSWRGQIVSATRIVQGYLARGDVTVRARIRGDRAYLTVKGRSQGIARSEFEYEIPVADAETMLAELADGPVVEKTRNLVEVGGHTWELDVFAGENSGLVMAEVEVPSADTEFPLPEWAGQEVSDDPRYYNVNLAQNPYRNWGGRAEP